MKDKYISIIIPCYNVENTLDRCIQSILKQDFKNFEIILVDDCSNDKTWDVIKKYSNEYSNIIGFKNETNKGAGYSRNLGIKNAKYDYISFIDSDDYVENNFYYDMLEKMIVDKSDLVVCDIYVKYDTVTGDDIRNIACENPKDKYCFINNGLAASPCNKLFKKKQLLKYPFPEGIMNEDIATVIAIMMEANKISYCKSTYYNYIQYASSVQNSTLSDKRLDIFKSIDLLAERVPCTKKTKKYWDAIVYNQIIMFLIYVVPKENDWNKRRKFLKKFDKLSRKYELRKNRLWWGVFLPNQGRKHKFYYRVFMKLNCNGFSGFASTLISIYKLLAKNKKPVIKDDASLDDLEQLAIKQSKLKDSDIRISVVIPNYNYEKFLYQRLYSILYQHEKISEILILDDCSSDNSRKMIDEIEERLNKYINIKKVYNTTNSGSAFRQWKKGFEMATGDYVWIAEEDDYCSNKFLSEVIKPIKHDKNVVISYVDTAFIDKNGFIILRTIKPEIDILKTGHWDHNFINDGVDEIRDYSYLNCTIANVSSVLFKKNNYEQYFKESGEFRQAGDWLFYLNVMSDGKIAYRNKPINFYRVHGNNVTSQTKKQAHFDEILRVHSKIKEKFGISSEQNKNIEERYEFLKRVWNLNEKE